MSDPDDALEAIARAARELVPQLTERLARHGLGEIEVASGDLRVRVANSDGAAHRTSSQAADAAVPTSAASSPATATGAPTPPSPGLRAPSAASEGPAMASVGVASPAVGFFVYAERLGPGLEVEKGDPLGQVEMLGVRHDVRAPRRGTVRSLVAESGEAVEYGQIVLELEASEAGER
jgi:acetyl-CoA carboxylase biotin carboxyl carrier protein